MKVCPQCQNTYTDDSLQFCLQDGTPLTNQLPAADWSEPETIISPSRSRRAEQIHTTQNPQATQTDWQQSRGTDALTAQLPPQRRRRKSNAFRVLMLVSLALILFFGLVGAGTWILISNMQREILKINSNKSSINLSTNVNVKPLNTTGTNRLSNANTVSNITPTPKPTLKPEDAAKAKSDIADITNGWKSALENLDLNSHMSYYADTIDYYKSGSLSIGKVRADKQRALDTYNSINVTISNAKTTVDDSGEKATTVFDKEWIFRNGEKTNSGKVQQQLLLSKSGGKWRITSEKELKIYYVNK
jgi:hypothetical protein